jgi:Fe-S-cluster-containing dehydrogenase component
MARKLAIIHEYDRCIKCRGCVVSCQRNFVNSSLGKPLDPGTGAGTGITPEASRVSPDDATVIKPQFGYDFPPFIKYNCWHCANPPCAGRCPFRAISKKEDGAVVINFSRCNPTACNLECVKDCGHGGYPKVGKGNNVDLKAYKCDMCYGRRLPLLQVGPDNVVRGNPDVIDIKTFGSFRTEAKSYIGTTNTSAVGIYKVSACVLACPTGALRMGYQDELDSYIQSQGYHYTHGLPGDSWKWAGNVMSAPPTADPLMDDHLVPLTHELVDGKLVPVGLLIGGLYLLYRRKVEKAAEEG